MKKQGNTIRVSIIENMWVKYYNFLSDFGQFVTFSAEFWLILPVITLNIAENIMKSFQTRLRLMYISDEAETKHKFNVL